MHDPCPSRHHHRSSQPGPAQTQRQNMVALQLGRHSVRVRDQLVQPGLECTQWCTQRRGGGQDRGRRSPCVLGRAHTVFHTASDLTQHIIYTGIHVRGPTLAQ